MSLYTHTRPTGNGVIIQGDTIPEFSITFGAEDGINLLGATIRMQVYWNGQKYIDISNGAGITIDSALQMTIDARAYTEEILPSGTGYGDIEFTIDGVRTTMFGITYTITAHKTI